MTLPTSNPTAWNPDPSPPKPGLCPLDQNGQHSWLPWLQITDRSWVTRCLNCDRVEQWDT